MQKAYRQTEPTAVPMLHCVMWVTRNNVFVCNHKLNEAGVK